MITLEQIAQYFEDGLNAVYNKKYIKFSIATNAGIVRESIREQNTVTHFITGSLVVNSSSNDANLLVMGANGLSLQFPIPTRQPRATANEKVLPRTQNGRFPFVDETMKAINDYFKEAQSFILMDGEDEYSLSFHAGTSMAEGATIEEEIGECVMAFVSITLYFIKGGIISKDVQVTIDGERIPFQVLRTGRSSELSRDVFSGKYISKAIASSTAFSIDVQFPANADVTTAETVTFLLDGTPNVAHFVTLKYGADAEEKIYFMTFDNVNTNAQGVTVSGITVAFLEVVEVTDALNYPAGYQAGIFRFSSSETPSITFTLPENCKFYIGGVTGQGEGVQTITLTPDDFVLNEETGEYNVYLVTDKTVNVISDVPFEVVYGGR